MSMKKVVGKQHNAKLCFICGMHNDLGLKAQFYELDTNEIAVLFTANELHQGYPGRIHGGILGSILDELIGRGIQIKHPDTWSVTVELNIKYHNPVPYDVEIKGIGRIDRDTRLLAEGTGEIYLSDGTAAVTATAKYMKMPKSRITGLELKGDEWKVYELESDPKEI